MQLIDQSYEILKYPEDACLDIESIGRTCYKSEDKITGRREDAEKFVKVLRDRGHHAMLEFGIMQVKFITNRGVTHELVRHRLCSFAQESTRYCNYGGKDMEFIKPVWLAQKDIDAYFMEHDAITPIVAYQFLSSLSESEMSYKYLLDNGWKPQQAREVLPNALKTEIVVQANLREWRHIFQLRCSSDAHPQIHALMLPLLHEMQEKIPALFEDI